MVSLWISWTTNEENCFGNSSCNLTQMISLPPSFYVGDFNQVLNQADKLKFSGPLLLLEQNLFANSFIKSVQDGNHARGPTSRDNIRKIIKLYLRSFLVSASSSTLRLPASWNNNSWLQMTSQICQASLKCSITLSRPKKFMSLFFS